MVMVSLDQLEGPILQGPAFASERAIRACSKMHNTPKLAELLLFCFVTEKNIFVPVQQRVTSEVQAAKQMRANLHFSRLVIELSPRQWAILRLHNNLGHGFLSFCRHLQFC